MVNATMEMSYNQKINFGKYDLKTDKFDVLRGRLLGNRDDFHWQLSG